MSLTLREPYVARSVASTIVGAHIYVVDPADCVMEATAFVSYVSSRFGDARSVLVETEARVFQEWAWAQFEAFNNWPLDQLEMVNYRWPNDAAEESSAPSQVRDVERAEAREEIVAYLRSTPGAGAVEIATSQRLDIDLVLELIDELVRAGRLRPC